MSEPNYYFQKVIAILRELELDLRDPIKKSNFQTRITIQKIVFLSKFMGINLKKYIFSLYRNGPYSPDLTADYYEHNELVTTLQTDVNLNQEEKKRINKINKFILNHSLGEYHLTDFLEAISTAFFFKFYDRNLTDIEIYEKTKSEKPFISDKIITIAIHQLKNFL